MKRPQAVMLRAELRNCHWDEWYYNDPVVEEMPVYGPHVDFDHIADVEWREKMQRLYNPARYVADCIAMTRNIAATWDIVSVTLDGVDVTKEVNAEWLRWYVSRRPDFV